MPPGSGGSSQGNFWPAFISEMYSGRKRIQKSPVEEEIEAIKVAAPNPGGNGETADEDIVAIAEEIFNGGKS